MRRCGRSHSCGWYVVRSLPMWCVKWVPGCERAVTWRDHVTSDVVVRLLVDVDVEREDSRRRSSTLVVVTPWWRRSWTRVQMDVRRVGRRWPTAAARPVNGQSRSRRPQAPCQVLPVHTGRCSDLGRLRDSADDNERVTCGVLDVVQFTARRSTASLKYATHNNT